MLPGVRNPQEPSERFVMILGYPVDPGKPLGDKKCRALTWTPLAQSRRLCHLLCHPLGTYLAPTWHHLAPTWRKRKPFRALFLDLPRDIFLEALRKRCVLRFCALQGISREPTWCQQLLGAHFGPTWHTFGRLCHLLCHLLGTRLALSLPPTWQPLGTS